MTHEMLPKEVLMKQLGEENYEADYLFNMLMPDLLLMPLLVTILLSPVWRASHVSCEHIC